MGSIRSDTEAELLRVCFPRQVQAYLSSLVGEELEEMKKELIFIKNIFIKQEQEEEKMGDAEDGIEEGGGGQEKDNGQ